MTIQGQLAQSSRSVQFQSVLPPIDFLSSAYSLNTGLLGNSAGQFRERTSFINATEKYGHPPSATQPIFRLAMLKRRKFTAAGKEERIARSLNALNAPQPTHLPVAEWKLILEEIEDED
jgi:hypothetical protein